MNAEEAARLHDALCKDLERGAISDPEAHLFLDVATSPPDVLRQTPHLVEIGMNGRFDLLFTDGEGTFVAVEVKQRPEVSGSGRSRRNRREKGRQRRQKLVEQTRLALLALRERVGPGARAIGLWLADQWQVVADLH